MRTYNHESGAGTSKYNNKVDALQVRNLVSGKDELDVPGDSDWKLLLSANA